MGMLKSGGRPLKVGSHRTEHAQPCMLSSRLVQIDFSPSQANTQKVALTVQH